jgi:hypothetical protein
MSSLVLLRGALEEARRGRGRAAALSLYAEAVTCFLSSVIAIASSIREGGCSKMVADVDRGYEVDLTRPLRVVSMGLVRRGGRAPALASKLDEEWPGSFRRLSNMLGIGGSMLGYG